MFILTISDQDNPNPFNTAERSSGRGFVKLDVTKKDLDNFWKQLHRAHSPDEITSDSDFIEVSDANRVTHFFVRSRIVYATAREKQ